MMTLDVLISTIYRSGIERVVAMELPQVEGVRYVVSWQMPEGDVPAALLRDDVTVVTLDCRGISRNRNHAMAQSTADLCLVADDDLHYTADQLRSVIKVFESNPDVELAAFRYSGPDNRYYPATEADLSVRCPKGYSPVCFELAFRREVGGRVGFNELAGPGDHPLQAGEDDFFLLQAQRRGVRCRFFPITITHHAGLTTGCRPMSAGVLKAQGAFIAVRYGLTGPLRVGLFAWRASRSGKASLLTALRHVAAGYVYGLRHFHRDATAHASTTAVGYGHARTW